MRHSNSILLGAAVYEHLTQDTEIQQYVNDRIYPITVTKEDTPFPFIVYSKTGIDTTYSKDDLASEDVEIQIIVCSHKYIESIYIAQAVRNSLELKSGTIQGNVVKRIELISVEEDFYADAFFQKLIFKFKL